MHVCMCVLVCRTSIDACAHGSEGLMCMHVCMCVQEGESCRTNAAYVCVCLFVFVSECMLESDYSSFPTVYVCLFVCLSVC